MVESNRRNLFREERTRLKESRAGGLVFASMQWRRRESASSIKPWDTQYRILASVSAGGRCMGELGEGCGEHGTWRETLVKEERALLHLTSIGFWRETSLGQWK